MSGVAVSVCIPAYRNPEMLEHALASIDMQTFRNYEIVITDDSPDDSVENLVGRLTISAPLTYRRNVERLGSPENWNSCVALASGDLIKILHHDDWFTSPESLSRYVELMRANEQSNLGFSATAVSNPDGSLQRINRPPALWVAAVSRNPRWVFPWNLIGSPSATIYRRSAALSFDPKLKWVVDVDFYIRMLINNPALSFAAQPLVATVNGLPTQVTAQSLGNRRVELFEWTYLYARLFEHTGANPHPLQMKFMWDLLGRHNVNSLQDLCDVSEDYLVPTAVMRMVQVRHRLCGLRSMARREHSTTR